MEQKKEIDFTRLVKQEAKKYGISVREKCFADLMAAGWKDIDAYLMAGLYNMIYPKETNKHPSISEMNSCFSLKVLSYFLTLFSSFC